MTTQNSSPWASGQPFASLLVGVDMTPSGDRVLDTALGLASAGRLPVYLATVRSPGVAPEVDAAEAETRADVLRRAGIDVTVTLLESNDAAEALTALAGGLPAPLLCFATHARTAFGARLLGSVTTDVELQWPGPVLLVGPKVAAGTFVPAHLLVTLDESDDVTSMTSLARSWHTSFGGTVGLFEVVHPDTLQVSVPRGEVVTPALTGAAAAVQDAPARSVVDRDPARAILTEAAHPGTVIAVHSHLRRGLARMALGSVAGDVLHAATGPVLVLPRGGDVTGPPSVPVPHRRVRRG